MQEKGNLSINSENFLPIIKKWLYTDKDIFIRELVSNACDAVTKLQKLSLLGEAELAEDETFSIRVVLNQDEKTLQVIDNGIGMTADEVKKYINQIAFSGATDFLTKFQEKTEQENEIIGHFGLGFYSAFMVADRVEIDTLSFQNGAQPAKWLCEGGIDYEMEDGSRETRGTTITLYLGEDGKEFLDESTLYAALTKYCAFMPVPIFVDIVKEETEEEKSAITAAAAKFISDNSADAVRVMNASQENVEEMLRLYKIQDKMRDAIEAEIDTNVTDAECAQKTFSYVKFEKPQEGGESGETEASQDADAEGAEPEKTAEEVKADAQALLDGGADNLETAAEAGSYTVLKCSYGPDDLEEEKNTTSLDVEILKTADKLKDGVMADALAETDDSYYVIRMDSVDDKEAAEKKKESILSQRRSEKYDEVLQKYKDDSKWTVHEKEWKKVNFENLYTIKTAEQETAADDGTAGSTTADDGAAGTEGSTAADDGTAGTEGSTAADDGTAGAEEGQEPQTAADDGAAGTEEGQEPQTAAE